MVQHPEILILCDCTDEIGGGRFEYYKTFSHFMGSHKSILAKNLLDDLPGGGGGGTPPNNGKKTKY